MSAYTSILTAGLHLNFDEATLDVFIQVTDEDTEPEIRAWAHS